jgi:FkbH-like protein
MILKIDDFAGWKINWSDKAQNIIDLVSELNLGLQSAVFIDDNPVERARIREALPEVFVPDWPANKMLYRKALQELHCFDMPSLTDEDVKKTKMYTDEKKRGNLKKNIGSVDEWLKTLDINVTASKLGENNKQRIVQLFNKTNQMNLSTRRMTESELVEWLNNDGNRRLWAFTVKDKFGDSGLIGIASLDILNDTKGQIIDFILSCRVFGRKIEETMLFTIIEYSREVGLKVLNAKYIPTPKNKPCLEFWQTRSGFECRDKEEFVWDLNKSYSLPEAICLNIDSIM